MQYNTTNNSQKNQKIPILGKQSRYSTDKAFFALNDFYVEMMFPIFAHDLMVGFIFKNKTYKGKATSVFMIGFVFRGL